MVWRSMTVTPAGMSTIGVGTRVAVTTVSGVTSDGSSASAGAVISANTIVKRNRGMRVLHRQKVDSPPAGSPPPHRYTPPEARAQSRRRPVSWLAGRRLVPPSRLAAMACWDRTRRTQLRGQQPCPRARPEGLTFPFQPLAPGFSPGVAGHRRLEPQYRIQESTQ